MPSLKVDEGANEPESAENTQSTQLQNTSCLGRNLGKPPGAECSTSSKKRKRESEDVVGAVGQYEMMRALDRQLILAGLGGLKAFAPHTERCTMLQAGELRYEVEMEPWDEYANILPPGTPWKRLCVINLSTKKKKVRGQPLPLSKTIASALRHDRRGRGQHAYGAVHAGRLALTIALAQRPIAQVCE